MAAFKLMLQCESCVKSKKRNELKRLGNKLLGEKYSSPPDLWKILSKIPCRCLKQPIALNPMCTIVPVIKFNL